VHGVGAVADADGEDGVDAGGVGSAEDFVAVGGGLGVGVEVGVGVGEEVGLGHRISLKGTGKGVVKSGDRVG
jgi:hypothetical protein